MGNPTFWWYPSESVPTVEEVDLGGVLTDLQVTPDVVAIGGETTGGQVQRAHLRSRRRVRIVYERFVDRDLFDALLAMQRHLDGGGAVAFCADADKAFAAFARSSCRRGQTAIIVDGDPWAGMAGAHSLSVGDRVAVQSPNPEGHHEIRRVAASFTASRVPLQSGLVYDYGSPVLVRYEDYYPLLRLPEDLVGRPIATHDRRLTYTMDITLVEDLPSLMVYSGQGVGTLAGALEASGVTLDGGVARSEDAEILLNSPHSVSGRRSTRLGDY